MFSSNSEGGVGLGKYFHVDSCREYTNIWSGGLFYEVLRDRKHSLLITYVFQRIFFQFQKHELSAKHDFDSPELDKIDLQSVFLHNF